MADSFQSITGYSQGYLVILCIWSHCVLFLHWWDVLLPLVLTTHPCHVNAPCSRGRGPPLISARVPSAGSESGDRAPFSDLTPGWHLLILTLANSYGRWECNERDEFCINYCINWSIFILVKFATESAHNKSTKKWKRTPADRAVWPMKRFFFFKKKKEHDFCL